MNSVIKYTYFDVNEKHSWIRLKTKTASIASIRFSVFHTHIICTPLDQRTPTTFTWDNFWVCKMPHVNDCIIGCHIQHGGSPRMEVSGWNLKEMCINRSCANACLIISVCHIGGIWLKASNIHEPCCLISWINRYQSEKLKPHQEMPHFGDNNLSLPSL